MDVDPQLQYDFIFDAALSMARAAAQDPEGGVIASQIASLLFGIINEWERDIEHFPPIVLQAACELAVAWNALVLETDYRQETGS